LRRKIEKPSGQNPDTTVYAYDGMYAVCEFGGHLDLQYKYIYANGLLLARYDESPADSHYYHHDGLGSIMGLTNESGNVEQSYFYDGFGNSLGSYGSVSNHYLYTGQEYDGDITGLYNLRARYYDMRIGRFVSEDKVSPLRIFPQTSNNYIYALNSPLNLVDPLGLWCMSYRPSSKREIEQHVTGTGSEITPWKWQSMRTLYRDCLYRRWKIYYNSGWIRWLKIDFYFCYENCRFFTKAVQSSYETSFFKERYRTPDKHWLPAVELEEGELTCPNADDARLPK